MWIRRGMYVAWCGRSASAEGSAEIDLAVIARQNVRRTNSRAGGAHRTVNAWRGDGLLGVVFPGWPELGPTRLASESWSVLSQPAGLPANAALSCLPRCVVTPEGVIRWGA